MRYYAKPDSHIWDKVKVVLDLSNYGIKRKLNNAAGVDTSNLAAKSIFLSESIKKLLMFQLIWII